MAKSEFLFQCTECKARNARAVCRCPTCGTWDSFVAIGLSSSAEKERLDASRPKLLSEITHKEEPRLSMVFPGVDHVLSGGLPIPSTCLFAGESSIGKSTLCLQIACLVAKKKRVLVVCSEEPVPRVANRARRLGFESEEIKFVSWSDFEALKVQVAEEKPAFILLDSLSDIGEKHEQLAVAKAMMDLCERHHCTAMMVNHLTGEGTIAGLEKMKHAVDIILAFSGNPSDPSVPRVLSIYKTRFGPPLRFSYLMGEDGLSPLGEDKPGQKRREKREKKARKPLPPLRLLRPKNPEQEPEPEP